MHEYRDSYASMLRFCTDFKTEMDGSGFNLKVLNFDAAGEPGMWPKQDVVGMGEMDLTLNDGIIEIRLMFAVSTYDDLNGFRMSDLLDRLVNKLIPGMRFKMVNAVNGQTRGFFVVRNGTHVPPPLSTDTRNVQAVMVSLLCDQTVRG